MSAATPATMPPHDANDLTIVSGKNNIDRVMWAGQGKGPVDETDPNGWSGTHNQTWSTFNAGKYPSIFDYAAFDYKYKYLPKINVIFRENTKISHLAFHYVKEGNGNTPWEEMSERWDGRTPGNKNLTIGTFDLKGDVMFEVKLGGNSNIDTINNAADRLSLTTNGNSSLTIQTLNQNRADSQLVIQEAPGSIVINALNQSGGSVYQRTEEVKVANITGGHYYQGYGPSGGGFAPSGDGGQIGTLNLQGGEFTQYAGQITTANLSGGVFTHNGGTLDNVVLKAGGSGSTFVNGTDSAFANITQEGGNHTIIGKVTKFTLASGSFTNNGTITTLTTSTTTKQASTSFYAAQDSRATANHITNNGTIDKLELTKDADSVTNNAVYNTGGGLASGIIKDLDVKSGNATINTLNGVGQGTAANVEPHTLSNINIAKDAKLTVDTLSVGLKGNQAMERVTINNNTGTQGSNKEFAVNKIQVTYIDGTFDPAKSINKNLTDYVSSNTISQSYVDSNSKPTFESSPELQGIGVKFNPDGTPIFEVEASLAASMTSVVVRQSMRRKMLIDTYLAEQNRRSLKNKERRTKQRIEAATLADARAQYQKDLAKYKLDLAKWDKLASTKENKALIAKYEQEDKAYQAALKQYQKDKDKYDKDKAKWDKANGKLAPAPIAPVAPKAPTKPNVKPNHKDYKKAMAAYTKAQQEHKTALAQYEKDLAKYKLDKEKWDKESQKLAKAGKIAPVAPTEPKAPTKPKILASKPEMPQEPKLGEISAELLAKHKVQGDFFIRAYGGTGSHKATNGAQTNSWSVGTLFGSTWDLALGQTSGNIGFYGGYEYIYNGYKQAHIDAQGHTGFLGLRFSHIFAKTKLAGFYYMADVNGGYSDISVGQDMNGMRFSANVGNINFGSSFRLGSSVYMYGSKSILFPSVGVGVEGGYLGEFEMRTDRSGELRYGGLSQGYAVTYAQANLNYYQEYGKRISTTLGGGFRYLMNTDINIMPTLNGKAYTIDEKTGRAAAVHVAPFFYQGTFVINYHTDKAGNFSAGYVAVGGELGITHNASVRWHYFF